MRFNFFAAALLGAAFAPCAIAQTVFINEIHYDNSGTDTGERVEVIAPAGTNLTGWKVIGYDGSGRASYATFTLSGTTTNQCGGYGTVVATTTGLQNGAPDGVALVNATGTLVQFLSYEGSFVGSGGAANGVTSVNIGKLEDGTAAAGQSLQLSGTGTTANNFVWNAQRTANFGACNTGQSFTTPDAAPTIASTSPAAGASGVALASNVTVNFSESITTTGTWFGLNCSISGAKAATVSGTGATRTIDPTVNFAASETCTLSVTGANVSDIDGVASPMSANYSASFTTLAAADAAPTVSSLVPAAGSVTVAVNSKITVNFSEAVTTTGTWFGLSCSASGNKTAVVSGSGATRTLDPSVDFTSLETCTLTVNAANVSDIDGLATAMAANYTATLKMAGAASGYYGSAVTSSASALRTSLHNIIDDHTKVSYTGIWSVIAQAEQDPMNSNNVLEIYKNASYPKVLAGNNNYNREHSWPKSLGFPNDGSTNFAYSDGHHLMASDIAYNSARGNKYYGNCPSGCTEYTTQANFNQGGGSGVYPGNSNWTNSVLWQTWNKRKGEAARAMFYMDIRYEGGTNGNTGSAEPNLALTDTASLITQSTGNTTGTAYMGLLSVLLQWHIDDPVDDREVLRNQIVFNAQGNRNPFIDHPEWVKCIYQSVCN